MARDLAVMVPRIPGALTTLVAIIFGVVIESSRSTQPLTGPIQNPTHTPVEKQEPTTANLRTLLSDAEELNSRVVQIVRRL